MRLYAVLLFVLVLECCVRWGHAVSNQLAAFHKAFEDARQELLGMSHLGADDDALLRQRRRTIDELLANFQKDLALADELDNNDVGKGDWLSGGGGGGGNGDLSALGASKGCKGKACGGDWKMARDLSALHKRLNANDDLNEVAKLNLKYKGLSTKLKSPLPDSSAATDSDSGGSSSGSSSSASDANDDEDSKGNSKKFQSILDKIEENNNRIGTIIQNANLDQTDTASLMNNIKNTNAESKSTLGEISSYKGASNLNLNSLGTLKKDKNKYKMPELDLDLDEKPLQYSIDQLQVSNLANDQREQTKNDLSHEADYKLSKIEQDAAEHKKDAKWKAGDMVRRSAYFNPMNEIKLKTSFRLMDRGFGPSLPSNALIETRRNMKVEDMLKRIEQNYDLDTADASAKDDFDKLDSVLSVDENNIDLLKTRYKRLEDDLLQNQPDMNSAYNYDDLLLSKTAFDNLDDVKVNPEFVGVIGNRKQDEIFDNGNSNDKGLSPLNDAQGLAAYQGPEKRRVKRIGPLIDSFRAESLATAGDLNEASVENSAANMQRSRRSVGIVEQSKKRKKRSVDDGSANKQKPPLLLNHTESVQNHSLQKRALQMSPRVVSNKKSATTQVVSQSQNQAQPRNVVPNSDFHNGNDREKRIYDEYNSQRQQPMQQQSSLADFDFGNVARTLGFERFDNLKSKSTFVNTDGMHFDNLYNDNISANSTSNANNNNHMASADNNKNNNYMNDHTNTKEKLVPFGNSNSNNENSNNFVNPKVDSESGGKSNRNNNGNQNHQQNDAKIRDESSKGTKSITCSMPSSSESSSNNNNNYFTNTNSPFGNFSENTDNNDSNNQNYNGSSYISESTDDSKTLMLALRDEILNCSAFSKLKNYLKSHTKNITDGKIDNTNTNSNSKANKIGGGAVEGKMDVVVDTTNTSSKAGKYDTSNSPHISTEPPDQIQHRDALMKLNININASVIGGQKSTNFIGNGTINVRPSYTEERERRGVIFPNYESPNKRKCKTKNEFEFDASSSAHVDNVMDGKMSAQVVRTLFNFVRDHPTLKVLWPSLKNNHLPNCQRTGPSELSIMGDTEKAKSTQLLMQRAMSTINDIIEQQIRSRTCIPLRPDLNDFYELILNSCAEQESNRDKRESTLSLANAFSEEVRAIDPNKIEAKSRIVKKLLKQYEELPHEDQEQVAGIRDDLLRDLMYLRKLRDGQNELRERRKREVVERRQQQLNADAKEVNPAVQRLEAEYTPQFLKLLKTAEIFRDAA